MYEAIGEEMSDAWVRAVADRIEAAGFKIHDAHETAIVVTLSADAQLALGAEPGHMLLIGWDDTGTHWGLTDDGARMATCEPLGGDDSNTVADRTLAVLRTGWPEPRPLMHATPFTGETNCPCTRVYPCGGIIPDPDCPDHGNAANPAMQWHWEANCTAR